MSELDTAGVNIRIIEIVIGISDTIDFRDLRFMGRPMSGARSKIPIDGFKFWRLPCCSERQEFQLARGLAHASEITVDSRKMK